MNSGADAGQVRESHSSLVLPPAPDGSFYRPVPGLRGGEVCGWLLAPSPLRSPRGKLLCCGSQKDHLCLSLSCCPTGVCWNNHRHASQSSAQPRRLTPTSLHPSTPSKVGSHFQPAQLQILSTFSEPLLHSNVALTPVLNLGIDWTHQGSFQKHKSPGSTSRGSDLIGRAAAH